jgi:molecular chaperone GrpE
MISEHENNIDADVEFEATETFEDLDTDGEELSAKDKISTLQKKLKTSEAARRELQEELQRAKADFLNARRRLEEDKERYKDRLRITFIEELLPLCDSFYMAMSNEAVWNAIDPVWRTGVESIHGQLQSILSSNRVSVINPKGKPFDPQKHDAVSNAPVTDEAQHDTVVSVLQPGYEMTIGDKTEIIRAARVVVGSFTHN